MDPEITVATESTTASLVFPELAARDAMTEILCGGAPRAKRHCPGTDSPSSSPSTFLAAPLGGRFRLAGEDSHGIEFAEECGITFRACQLDHCVRNGRGFLAAGRKDTSRSLGVGAIAKSIAALLEHQVRARLEEFTLLVVKKFFFVLSSFILLDRRLPFSQIILGEQVLVLLSHN